jgi:hypothetical protein
VICKSIMKLSGRMVNRLKPRLIAMRPVKLSW